MWLGLLDGLELRNGLKFDCWVIVLVFGFARAILTNGLMKRGWLLAGQAVEVVATILLCKRWNCLLHCADVCCLNFIFNFFCFALFLALLPLAQYLFQEKFLFGNKALIRH